MRSAIVAAWIINRNSAATAPVHPLEIIPSQFRPPVEKVVKTEEELAEESRLAWKQLDYFFSRQGGPGNGLRKR
jgi:hypothetical protein